jgi:hypothetical protein
MLNVIMRAEKNHWTLLSDGRRRSYDGAAHGHVHNSATNGYGVEQTAIEAMEKGGRWTAENEHSILSRASSTAVDGMMRALEDGMGEHGGPPSIMPDQVAAGETSWILLEQMPTMDRAGQGRFLDAETLTVRPPLAIRSAQSE